MDYLVREITVTVARKDWKSGQNYSGSSGESTFSWTVCPPEFQGAWTREEAGQVQARVAKNLYSTLLLDATAKDDFRACKEIESTISFYEKVLEPRCEELPSPA